MALPRWALVLDPMTDPAGAGRKMLT